MDIKESLEEFKVCITIPFPEGARFTLFGAEVAGIAITETVVVSWAVMGILIGGSLLLTRRLKPIPRGPQVFLETLVTFLNTFSDRYFGKRAKTYGPYIGSVFLFILFANMIPAFSPLSIAAFGIEPPFSLKPPTRDINLTAALAALSIMLVLVGGLRARGLAGWARNLFKPTPMMLPFNLLEYVIRPLSLCLRLFGNILGGFIIMLLVESALPVPLLIPAALSVYFDFFDGLIQAVVFSFLTTLFISEAVETDGH
ncbi:MAG: F0F1 ATP synthase subunit A [Spirochaetaceae bacterium]|jgi:F-type H+-transporting ATPase subunit a|nr:F0F1 ATP synthase subunit A [Spirochaetaceae bacterium]